MRNVIVIFLSVILNQVSAQWIQQNSTTTKHLAEVKFANELTGYVIGGDGILLKTNNGGNTWNQIETGTTEDLTALWLISPDIVFIGTSTGIVLITINSGVNWETINMNDGRIFDIHFINNHVGFIATRNSIFRTDDSGENWYPTNTNQTAHAAYEICFASDLIGYTFHNGILKTTDGGLNWISIKDDDSPDYNAANILTTCAAPTNSAAYFGSPYYLGIYKTIDGGQNLTYTNRQVQSLEFPSPQIGYSIDSTNGSPKIIRTMDGGESWYTVYPQTHTVGLNDLHFVNENKGWAVGSNGVILFTNTGGEAITNIILQEDRITINPDFNCNQIDISGDFTNYDIHIKDEFNNIVANFTGASSPIIFNTRAFDNQYLTIQHQSIENVRFRTILKFCVWESRETATPQFNLFSDSLSTFESRN